MCSVFWLFWLSCHYLPSDWLERLFWGSLTMARELSPESPGRRVLNIFLVYCIVWICFIVLLCVCNVPRPYMIYFPTVMAQHVCAESAVKHQANKQTNIVHLPNCVCCCYRCCPLICANNECFVRVLSKLATQQYDMQMCNVSIQYQTYQCLHDSPGPRGVLHCKGWRFDHWAKILTPKEHTHHRNTFFWMHWAKIHASRGKLWISWRNQKSTRGTNSPISPLHPCCAAATVFCVCGRTLLDVIKHADFQLNQFSGSGTPWGGGNDTPPLTWRIALTSVYALAGLQNLQTQSYWTWRYPYSLKYRRARWDMTEVYNT